MDEIKKLIKLINSGELYDAKEQLDKVTKAQIDSYKSEISTKVDIFKKKD